MYERTRKEILILKRTSARPSYLGLEAKPGRYRLRYFAEIDDLIAAAARRDGDAVLAVHEELGDEAAAFCRRLKDHPRAGDLPIILLGEFNDCDEAISLLAAGADELLPVNVEPTYGRLRIDVWLRMKARLNRISLAKRRIQEDSKLDPLTGVANRATFEQWMDKAFADRRQSQGLTLLLIDVDNFKTLNDNYGHRFGDYVLREVGRLLRARARETDRIARYGGDEFAILARGPDAHVLARALVRRIRGTKFRLGNRQARVTLSIGIAEAGRFGITSPSALIDAADKALYNAKAAGRDRAERYMGPTPGPILETRDLNALGNATTARPRLFPFPN